MSLIAWVVLLCCLPMIAATAWMSRGDRAVGAIGVVLQVAVTVSAVILLA